MNTPPWPFLAWKGERNIPGRFWTKVDRADASGCWLWLSTRSTTGYGKFWLDGQQEPAHRVAWMLTHGTIPEGMNICHRCDVRLCVRPAHLFLGTDADNMADMVAKGRSLAGERNPRYERGWALRRPCEICGAIFKPKAQQLSRGQGHYCSKKCMGIAHRGTGNPNYRHGRFTPSPEQ